MAQAPDPWSDENYLDAARSTGKPLEVRCAMAFLSAGWSVYPGIYLNDPVSGVPRELDVYAEKVGEPFRIEGNSFQTVVQVCVSCKGFKYEEERPITYSLSHATGLMSAPAHVLHHLVGGRNKVGQIIGEGIVRDLLNASSRVFGFSVVKISGNKLVSKGDRQTKGGEESLYPGMDSAVKAAMYWKHSDENKRERASLQLPILVLRHPWKDMILDGGEVKSVTECDRAYMVTVQPRHSGIAEGLHILSLIWSESAMSDLITYLDRLVNEFTGQVKLSLARPQV